MRTRSLCLAVLLPLAFVLSVACAGGPGDEPEPVEEPEIEEPPQQATKALHHFLCYETPKPDEAQFPAVELRDQFVDPKRTETFQPMPSGHKFCNPVLKDHPPQGEGEGEGEGGDGDEEARPDPEKIHDHFVVLNGNGHPDLNEMVMITNQFYPEGWPVSIGGGTQYLMLPAHKMENEHQKPAGLNHYWCRPTEDATPVDEPVDLEDQWDTYRNVRVLAPVEVCSPTYKQHDGDTPIEPVEGYDHLVCYALEHPRPPAHAVQAGHQLDGDLPGGQGFITADLAWLCVPSYKQRIGPEEEAPDE